jgi:hypothetical protein
MTDSSPRWPGAQSASAGTNPISPEQCTNGGGEVKGYMGTFHFGGGDFCVGGTHNGARVLYPQIPGVW